MTNIHYRLDYWISVIGILGAPFSITKGRAQGSVVRNMGKGTPWGMRDALHRYRRYKEWYTSSNSLVYIVS